MLQYSVAEGGKTLKGENGKYPFANHFATNFSDKSLVDLHRHQNERFST